MAGSYSLKVVCAGSNPVVSTDILCTENMIEREKMTQRMYFVECQECENTWYAPKDKIRVDLDEQCEYDDNDNVTDCWWTHDYYAVCADCGVERAIDILSDHDCCLND